MANTPDFIAFLLDQLGGHGAVTARPMFGGHGLYRAGVFFGLVDDDRLFLYTDVPGQAAFRDRGMGPFSPWPGHVMETYWQVPDEVVEEAPRLREWAETAIAARGRKPAAKTRRPRQAKAGGRRRPGRR